MVSEKMTISLEDFVRYFVGKWKIVAVILIVCIILFAGMTKLLGEEISVPHSEEYLYYEQESAWLERYLEESVLMQMNPTNIYEQTLFLGNISDDSLMKDYVTSLEVWDEIESERNKSFFYELLTWKESDTAGNVQLILRHVTEEECLLFTEYLKEKIQNYDKTVTAQAGEVRVVKDEELQDEQLRWYERINYSKSLLLESQAGYTIKVNMAAAVIVGGLCGSILSVVVVLGMFLFGKNREKISM